MRVSSVEFKSKAMGLDEMEKAACKEKRGGLGWSQGVPHDGLKKNQKSNVMEEEQPER